MGLKTDRLGNKPKRTIPCIENALKMFQQIINIALGIKYKTELEDE